MAESSINHCLELAHLPWVFCILRHHFQSLPPNWGEWQSGSKRRAAPSIWQGGTAALQSQSCTEDEEKGGRWGRKGESGKRMQIWRLSSRRCTSCVFSRLHFLPFANNSLLTCLSWWILFTFAAHVSKIPPLKKQAYFCKGRKKPKAIAPNNSIFRSFCCKWENCHNKARRSDLHTRINKSNIDSVLSTWRVFASQTNECLAMLLFPGCLWLVLTDIQAFGGVIREPRGVSRGEAFSAGLLHSLSSLSLR